MDNNANVCSIITNGVIGPNKSLNIDLDRFSSILIEIMDPLTIVWRKKREVLRPGDFVIGNKFKLLNSSTQPTAYRGIVYNKGSAMTTQNPIIMRAGNGIKGIFTQVFDTKSSSTNQIFNKATKLLPYIINNINYKQKDTNSTREGAGNYGKIDPRLIIVNRYIRENFHKPLTLQLLADLIGCNPVYLSNTYSKVFGITPIKHIQNLRMLKAKDLLKNTDYPIYNIATLLGYYSCSQFSQLFKTYYNVTPTQFRINPGIK